MTKTFRGGIHPHEFKGLTRDLPISEAPLPNRVAILMNQHTGAPCQPVVKKGDRVVTGQRVGEAQGFVSAPVHSSITGKVVEVVEVPHPVAGQPSPAVVIERDGAEEWAPGTNAPFDAGHASPAELKQMIHDAGIVGLGGAAFPTHVKLSPPANQPIDTVILNGAECEPYLTCDERLMREKPVEILEGLRIILRVIGCPRAIVAIEENKPEAFDAMSQAAKGDGNLAVERVRVKYPQGAEHQLIKTLLNREIPWKGGLPMAVGALVHNVGTAYAIRQAVTQRVPLISRVVTVTGDGVEERGNYLVRVGMSVNDLLQKARVKEGATKLILGGPLMGLAQATEDIPVIKGTCGVLVLTDAGRVESGPCIRCARCVEACPYRLTPSILSRAIEAEDMAYALANDVLECKECGCCAYVCPAKRPIVHQVKWAKAEIARKKAQKKA
jgi:electron transport complex protein RnfC